MKKAFLAILCMLAASAASAQNNLSVEWPAEGFYTTAGNLLVPLDTTVHFRALANGEAAQWRWEFPGATPADAEGQEAAVVYTQEGLFDVRLEAVVNGAEEQLAVEKGIQAGGAQYVWNISADEAAKMDVISLAWFGFYGGTNWLGMEKFAEYFHSPMQTAVIDSVAVWFGACDVATANAQLTLSVAKADEEGMPGETIGATMLGAVHINKTAGEPTIFRLEQPVRVDGPFFIIVEGFPNANGDGLAILCVRREVGECCTAYHLLADEDANYQPTGTFTWYQNVDDPTSLAISPWLRYDDATVINGMERAGSRLAFDGATLRLPQGVARLEVLSANGTRVGLYNNPSTSVALTHLPVGIYLVRADGLTMKIRR